jgi:hypothetical protein
MNIAQDSTHAKVTSPSLAFCKNQLEKITKRKEKMPLSKESVRSDYLPKLKLKQGCHNFTVEVQITSPSMDMNLCFNGYSLMRSGGCLP